MTILPSVFPSLPVDFTGQSLISHAGAKLLTEFVDALGFRGLCEDRLGQFVPAGASHRPGTVIGQLALMLAAGGEHVSDLDMFRSQPEAFGAVASNATVSRFFDRAAASPEAFTHGTQTLSRMLRTMVWEAAGDRSPAARATAADPAVLDIDATLVASHSDKESVAGDYKGGYGFSPFIASIDYGPADGTGEILAALLRPGNAGANSADDHISVFDTATAALPDGFHDQIGQLIGEKVLIRTDSAGASRKFLWHIHEAGAQFSVSYPVPSGKAHMVDWISDKQYWEPALNTDGSERADAWVINATDVIPLADYPPGTKLFLRAEPLHPGAQPTLLDVDGHRITAFLTNSPRWHGPTLDACHRARGRCENRIKTLKNSGMRKLPFFDFAANQAWADIAALASNLIAWLQISAIPTSHRARFWD
ncbi:IS1380 family transposase, partial [Arthrobacter sp. H14]|uniref:IS1380 family transposase n=1 Tax=Arthrobacter sp. H14 TaxID=1312959 RepID=UPI000688ADDB